LAVRTHEYVPDPRVVEHDVAHDLAVGLGHPGLIVAHHLADEAQVLFGGVPQRQKIGRLVDRRDGDRVVQQGRAQGHGRSNGRRGIRLSIVMRAFTGRQRSRPPRGAKGWPD
jgi:hypothetical protein